MGFASARAADEDRVALGVEEAAGGEFTDQSFIDRHVREDELVDILENRELGSAVTDTPVEDIDRDLRAKGKRCSAPTFPGGDEQVKVGTQGSSDIC